MELETLERRWRKRLEVQQRESAKKAAASAAAVAGARGSIGIASSGSSDSEPKSAGSQGENVVARTASWLDRAKSALKDPGTDKTKRSEPDEIRTQMQEVQRLIKEGPSIQQTSAGLAEAVDESEDQARVSGASSPDIEPADKRMRTAEDAEALVGFLRSVRASAASGQDF